MPTTLQICPDWRKFAPKILPFPLLGTIMVLSRWISVVLPAPLGPSRPYNSPARILQRHVIHRNCGAVIERFLAGTRRAQHLAPRSRCGKMLTQFLGVNCQNVHGRDYTMARQAFVISRRESIGCDRSCSLRQDEERDQS